MKTLFTTLSLFVTCLLYAQANTDIHIFDISKKKDNVFLKNGKNVTNSDSYDNQPYFLGNDVLIYAGTRNGQTDIIQNINGRLRTFNQPSSGSEYSPQKIPNGRAISAVRLDEDGLQRLYRYDPRTRNPEVLVKDAVVAYYVWADENTIVSADIVNDDLHLVVHNIESQESNDLGISVSRSFQKIPGTDLVSFIDKTNEQWVIRSINPETLDIQLVAALPSNIEDITWMKDGSILASKDNAILIKRENKSWGTLETFEDKNLQKLSRMTISPSGNQIAIVSEVAPVVE